MGKPSLNHKMKKLILAIVFAAAAAIPCSAVKASELKPHDARILPVIGRVAGCDSSRYFRFPNLLLDTVRTELADLARNSAGLALRFRSDASDIGARWKSLNCFNMNHMTPTGIRGVDLYVMLPDSSWTTVGAGRPLLSDRNTSAVIMTDMEPKMREYMLYLPLYDGVDSIYILTDSAACVLPPATCLPRSEKPVVVYGTSIVQGGCASRPGMVHTSILSRMLNREVINLGFSGNARLDPAVAQLMAETDAGVFVVDPLPNCTSAMLTDRLEAFCAILRRRHPSTPIILVESPMFPSARHSREVHTTLTEKNITLRSIFDRLRASDPHIYYMTTDKVLADPEATVDNYHFTDAGFDFFAHKLFDIINNLK